MLKTLIKNILFGKLFCSIEHTHVLQKDQINYLILKKTKKEFIKDKSGICSDIRNLQDNIKKGQHIYLVVNNEQVISKSTQEKLDPEKALQTAFPNLNIADFYYETYSSDHNTFISICRKQYIDDLIHEYTKLQFHVIDFSLGNLASTQLLKYIDKEELQTSNSILNLKNNQITDINKIEKELETVNYSINDLKISNNYVNPLSGIIGYYTNFSSTEKCFENKDLELSNAFEQKRIFDLGLKFGLGFIFTLLLFNFLIFSDYKDRIGALNNEIEVNEGYKGNLIALQTKVEKKKKIIDDIAATESSKVSKYLDLIGASVPNTIILTQINYQPLLKNIKENKEIQFISQEIIIKGKSTKGDDFSNWISSIELLDWVSSIAVINYGSGKKNTTAFQLKIILTK